MKKAAITIIMILSVIAGSFSMAFAEETEKTAPDSSELEARITALEEENAHIKALLAEIMQILGIQEDASAEDTQTDGTDTESKPVGQEPEAQPEQKEETKPGEENVLTEGNILYEDEFITLRYDGYEENPDGSLFPYTIVFIAENKTDVRLNFFVNELSLNGNIVESISGFLNVEPQSTDYLNVSCIAEPGPDGLTSIAGNFDITDISFSGLLNEFSYYDFSFDSSAVR